MSASARACTRTRTALSRPATPSASPDHVINHSNRKPVTARNFTVQLQTKGLTGEMSKPNNHCELCNKSFTSPANLERHKLSSKHKFLHNLSTVSYPSNHQDEGMELEDNSIEQHQQKPQEDKRPVIQGVGLICKY